MLFPSKILIAYRGPSDSQGKELLMIFTNISKDILGDTILFLERGAYAVPQYIFMYR